MGSSVSRKQRRVQVENNEVFFVINFVKALDDCHKLDLCSVVTK